MPTFTKGKSTVIYLDKYDLTRYLNEVTFPGEIEALDTTTFGTDWTEMIPGEKGGEYSLGGYHSTDANTAANLAFKALAGAGNKALTVGLAGSAIGAYAEMALVSNLKHDSKSTFGGLTPITASGSVEQGPDAGVFLHGMTAETATGNSTAVDNGAATTNGWAANLHVSAVSGSTPSLTVTVYHSVDASTWVLLGTFTAATTTTGQQITGTGTVNRHVRAQRVISGSSPSFTYAVSFARR
jgi:hypothetical protein